MQKFNHAFENAPRIAEFRKGVESGASRQKAALAARDITLDFQKKGVAMHMWNSIVPFQQCIYSRARRFLKYLKPKTDENGNVTFKEHSTSIPPWIGLHGDSSGS